MDILIVSSRNALWQQLKPAFEDRGGLVRTAATLEEALQALHDRPAALVVLDMGSDGEVLRHAVFRVLSIDAMIHTAAVSSMDAEAFHDAMEGLGMLTSLPEQPTAGDVDNLMDAMDRLSV